MAGESPDTGELHSFSQFIAQVDEGALHHDLSDAIREIVAQLNNARAAGATKPVAKMALNIAFKLDGPVVEVVGDFKTTLPKVPREKSVFYTTEGNKLSRNNPKQMKLSLRDITTGGGESETIRAV